MKSIPIKLVCPSSTVHCSILFHRINKCLFIMPEYRIDDYFGIQVPSENSLKAYISCESVYSFNETLTEKFPSSDSNGMEITGTPEGHLI